MKPDSSARTPKATGLCVIHVLLLYVLANKTMFEYMDHYIKRILEAAFRWELYDGNLKHNIDFDIA